MVKISSLLVQSDLSLQTPPLIYISPLDTLGAVQSNPGKPAFVHFISLSLHKILDTLVTRTLSSGPMVSADYSYDKCTIVLYMFNECL